jgi:hypothetical protein
VRDKIAFEAAHHMQKTVHLRQLVEQLTGDAAPGSATFQPGNVRVGDFGIDGLLRVEHARQFVYAWVGDIHHRGVNFDAPGTGHGGSIATRQGIEYENFSDLTEKLKKRIK